MRKLLSLIGVILVAGAVTASAQQTPSPRMFKTQQTHYLRFTLNYNSCVILAAATTCVVKVGSLPYNAFLTVIHTQIITAFNPTTSATWGIGVAAAGGAGIKAALNVFTGQSGVTTDTSFTGVGESVTGNGATATGANGGFDVYATYTVGAAGSQGTAGKVVFIIEYIAPNDGSCSPVPITTSTATAC